MKQTWLILIVLLVVGGGAWVWYQQSMTTTAPIAQVLTGQPTSQSGSAVESGSIQQDMVIPNGAIASIENASEAVFKPIATATTYTLGESHTIDWVGRKVGGKHQGTLQISQGAVQVEKGVLIGGGLIFDMNTITTSDGAGADLDTVLKGDDFFAVATYPTASFIVKSVSGGQITGVLTMKGVSKQITFPGVVIIEDDSVVVTAEFALDRKQWGVTGGGGMVSEFIELSFTIRFVP